MVNAYPFFGFTEDTLDFALFRPNFGARDRFTGLAYANMLDAQLDAVYSALGGLGFGDVEIVIAETGWPSIGEPWQVGVDVDNAAEYNRNLIRHVMSGVGTPLMPNRTFETYVFALFNEDLKPGPVSERNFGLFRADLTPVYDVGLLRTSQSGTPRMSEPLNPTEEMQWCMARTHVGLNALQASIDYVMVDASISEGVGLEVSEMID
ncbi:Glucan endo-1,3-beta-glucosidase [Acorus calamus]|uniref:Glucan endo-1,3-beta-glucosidase n=1 Tax=Acorus calamus TaxID=4465 RepID=A0AAV9EPH1_ACOCL|nr:Glucan endo-1,3-beta-glucosidase [Acorus calamus]